MTPKQQVQDIRDQIQSRFGVEGPSLAVQLRRLGRRVPKAIKVPLHQMAEAEKMLDNPKLAHQIDTRQMALAHEACCAGLSKITLMGRRKAAVLGALGGFSANLIILFVILVLVLVWRGFV